MKKEQILDDCKHLIRVLEGLAEVGAMTVLYFLFWRAMYRDSAFYPYYGRGKWILMGIYAVLMLVVFTMSDSLKFGHLKFGDIYASQIIGSLIVNFVTYFQLSLMNNAMLNVIPMLLITATDIVIAGGCCYLFTLLYHSMFVPHDLLLIYGSDSALDLKFKMDARKDQYTITEIISADCSQEQLVHAISRHDAVILNNIIGQKRNDIAKYCYERGIRLYLVPKISDIILQGGEDITLFDTPLKLVRGRGLTLPQRFLKRALDLFFSCLACIIFSPLMLAIALAIKLEDHGPVFYRQGRVTRGGKVFQILKFRSMIIDAEKGGYDLSMRANGEDPRITKVGRVIRAIRADELPQLLNILKGDMSIVGPRPERVENVEAYARDIPEWHLREKVKGGLTGYAQIYGRYNTSPVDKTKLDVMYIENYSFFLDLKLMIMTIRILFTKESTEGFDATQERIMKRQELVSKLEKEKKKS